MSRLIELRMENPALRASRYARLGKHIPNASIMDWFDQNGEKMESAQWKDPGNRTLQYVAASTPESGAANRVLLIVHGTESPINVRLPAETEDAHRFVSLSSSADERPGTDAEVFATGDVLPVYGTSMRLFRIG